jgi:serine/threonine protein kinase
VLEHGWLEGGHSFYYINMEYCPETPEDRIKNAGAGIRNHPPIYHPLESYYVYPDERANQGAQTVPPGLTPESPFPNPTSSQEKGVLEGDTTSTDIDWDAIGSIINDVVSGLIYMHGNGVVHRDIKPRNGKVIFD